MDDRLQRRLRDADPLTATTGWTPDPSRLDAIKGQIMESNDRGLRSAMRPKALGAVAVAAFALAVVLVGANLLRPTATTLAWDRTPTPVDPGQKAAATAACGAGLSTLSDPGAAIGGSAGGGVFGAARGAGLVSGSAAGGGPAAGGAVGGGGQSGTVTSGNGGPTIGGSGHLPPSSLPSHLPPLVSLELHGAGGIAIFADDSTAAYCLLVQQDGRLTMGGLLIPSANLTTVAVAGPGQDGSSGSASGQVVGAGVSRAVAADGDGFAVIAMAMSFDGESLGIIAGTVPTGAASVTVTGGPADGATATVTDGRFALWAPSTLGGDAVTITALDASGRTVASQTLFGGPPPDGPRTVMSTTTP